MRYAVNFSSLSTPPIISSPFPSAPPRNSPIYRFWFFVTNALIFCENNPIRHFPFIFIPIVSGVFPVRLHLNLVFLYFPAITSPFPVHFPCIDLKYFLVFMSCATAFCAVAIVKMMQILVINRRNLIYLPHYYLLMLWRIMVNEYYYLEISD